MTNKLKLLINKATPCSEQLYLGDKPEVLELLQYLVNHAEQISDLIEEMEKLKADYSKNGINSVRLSGVFKALSRLTEEQ